MGMSTRIGRRVTVTKCDCMIVDESNDVSEEQVVLYGDYNDMTRAQNAVRKKLQNNRVLVKAIHQSYFYASMPIEKFLDEADQITETITKE